MIDRNEIRPQVPKINVTKSGAEFPLSEAKFPQPFRIVLEYGPPARGTWTIAHSTMLVPGLHQIFVCCACCLQGVVLTADELEGGAERFSMVTVTNENLLKGDLEQMMIDGVIDILEGMDEKPRCVECFTSCIQHFLHIDLNVVYRKLNERYPDIDFIDGYMIPTLQRQFTPDMLGRRQLLRAVPDVPKKKAVNIAVNYFETEPETELIRMLKDGGYTVRDFAALSDYDEYKAMGEARANIYFLDASAPAAKDMESRIGQTAVFAPYSWDGDTIRRTLAELAERFDVALPDLDACEAAAEAKLAEAKRVIGDTPVAIDMTATPRPLGLARMLLEHGFNVYAVYADVYEKAEETDFKWLQENHPGLLLRAISHYKMRLLPRDDAERLNGVLAIGQKAAYFTGTDRFVNIIENSGLYGFHGIGRLAELMIDAWENPKDTEAIVTVKAWGCTG